MAPTVVVHAGPSDGLHLRIDKSAFRVEPSREQEIDPRMASSFQKHQFTILMVIFHVIFLMIYAIFAEFDPNTGMPGAKSDTVTYLNSKYAMFQDTHVMIFIGFGFLMTFLRRYGFSAVSVNMLLACFVIEWGMIINGFLSHEFKEQGKFFINLEGMLSADFATAIILISMGAMLGKLSPSQYLVMAFIETPVALVIEHIVIHSLHINDVGDSIVVHTFGAYFGLACSRGFAKKAQRGHENEGSIYHTDIFAMIGTLFLWVFWPSFNGGAAEPADARHRAVMNTFLSLVACTLTAFLASQFVDHHKRFNMVHMANATIAGGVAIGSTANVVLDPIYSLLIGSIAGVLSVVGYQYITPFLSSKFGIHDTCGVNNLHGMPGVLAGLFSVLAAWLYKRERYGDSLSSIYPGMAAPGSTEGHDETGQAMMQLAALGIVMAASIVSGLITGFVLRLSIFNQVREKEYYADGDYFETPDDYDFTTRIMTRIDHVEVTEKTALNGDRTEKHYPA